MTYEIKHTKSKIIPRIKGEVISFHVQVESDGWFMEDWTSPEEKGTENTLEKEFSDQAEQQIQQLLYKMQHVYKVDVGGFGERLRIKHHKVWKKVKPAWDKTDYDVISSPCFECKNMQIIQKVQYQGIK
ncbi:Ger(x)C family spore germination C-terminal domain-containing protein [Paenibacillus sp. MABNR03]|uniref:Ger(x)C family spore germination C-terminal domain-containing protein n=1 Tax=Paenibacillus sp. MABNR03 TaxID=3142626 RepID=UPI003D28B7A2